MLRRNVFGLSLLVFGALAPSLGFAAVITEIIDLCGTADTCLAVPRGIAVDGSGNVYVAGRVSNNAFKITPGGVITEIIDVTGDGTGNPLLGPQGIAVDGSGNVYVTGVESNNAFKITPAGVITEIIDITGDAAGNPLWVPRGIAVDGSQNVYVTGAYNNNAFKITPGGVITQIIDSTGDGGGNLFSGPRRIAADGSGNVYVTGEGSDNAFKITPGGVITQIIDSTGDGGGNLLDWAFGIAVDGSGNVYVTGVQSANAFKITPAGVITKIIDITGDAAGNPLWGPRSIAVDGSGNMYVAGRVSSFKITPGGVITQIIDSTGDGAGHVLEDPWAIAVDGSENVYVAGSDSHNAFKITPAGVITEIVDATPYGPGNAFVFASGGIAVDGSGNVYVTAYGSDNAFKITPDRVITQIIDSTGDGAGNILDRPSGIAVDASQNVYVIGDYSDNAFKITPGGVITEIIDSTGDGAGNGLAAIRGIAVDGSQNVYVTGGNSRNAFKITPGGVITQIIDSTGDGGGNLLDWAFGIAVDGSGNVYVTGHNSSNAFKITPEGTITEIIDSTGDGAGNGLHLPDAVAVDGSGNVYVPGFASRNVFEITPEGTITEIIDSTGDGAGNGLHWVFGIAVDGSGNVYIPGYLSDNAFKITPGGVITQIIDSTGDAAGNVLEGARGIAVDGWGNVYVVGATSHNVFETMPCSTSADCDVNATCINIPGSFGCDCNSGYSGDGVTCTDDDECVLSTDDCDVNATCINTPGSFTCTCNTCYSGDGVTCTDDDACEEDCCNGATCQTLTPQQCTDSGGTVVTQCLGDNDGSGGDDACEVDCCNGTTCQTLTPQQCTDGGGTVVTQCLGDNDGSGGDDACEVDCCNGTTCQTLTPQQCADGEGTVVTQCLGDNDGSGGDDACEVNCCVGSACQPESPQQCFDNGGTEVPLCLGDSNLNGEDDACEGPIVIPPGDDCWRTECGRTQFSFCNDPIPADFFGIGSLPYAGILELGGGGAGTFDTSMRRFQEMTLDDPPSVDSTPIELAALDLLSCRPITVDFSDSTTKDWHVSVQLSGVTPPQGTLTVTRTHFNGGTFDAEFFVQPVFTFTGVADPDDVRILDTGAQGLPPAELNTARSAPWVHELAAGSTVTICGTNFAPGVEEDPDTGDQCCRKVGHSAGSGSPPGHIHETAPPNCTACPSGACCLPGGICQVADSPGGRATAQRFCEVNLGGEYKGDSTDCMDSDGDGLADVLESASGCGACPAVDLCNLGTDPTRSDTDGDGCSDLEEVSGGSDPCDPCDSLVACALPLEDCNDDGIADACTSPTNDCNNDGIEDDCQDGACCYILSGPVCFIGPKTGPDPSCDYNNGLWYGPCATCDSFQGAVEVVEFGGQIFLHQVGSPEACPSELDGQGGTAGTCTGPLVDPWVSKPSEGTMCHNFGATGGGPVPTDFFCPDSDPACGSDVFNSVVCLEGVPLGTTAFGDFGDADTLILRTDDPFDRCALPSTTALSVDIEVVALSLANVDPITVTFNGGQNPELWDVAVDLSTTVTPTAGELTATKTHCNGGTYVSTLNVQPRFTFTRQSDNLVRVFDTGTQGLSHITLSQNDPAPWVNDVDPNLGIAADPCSQFHAGIEELIPLLECDCNGTGRRDTCDIEEETSLDCNESGVPDECELTDNDCNTNGIPDDCEAHCNNNGVPDDCDVDDSDPDGNQLVSSDCNNNGIPDECEADCNQNDVPDSCDVDGSDPDGNALVSADCNSNGVPDECEADCNHNDVPDACDLFVFLTSEDCTGNNRPDECDIRSGASQDCNGSEVPDECELVGNDENNNGIPDECEIFVPDPLQSASNPFGIPGGSDLNRAGGFAIPASAVAGGQEVAIRIRLVDLYVDSNEDAINGCPVRTGLPDLTLFDNQVRYLGPPSAFEDNDIASTPKFVAAELQCAPYYRDWSSAGLTAEFGAGVDTATVYFYGAEVLPCSVYEAQQGTQACVEFPSELCFSTALEIRTGLWGDLWPPFGDVSFTDIGKIVDAFKSIPFVPDNPPEGAPRKVRAMVRTNSPPFDSAINFTDIGRIVDAFKTIAYGEDGPTACP